METIRNQTLEGETEVISCFIYHSGNSIKVGVQQIAYRDSLTESAYSLPSSLDKEWFSRDDVTKVIQLLTSYLQKPPAQPRF